MKSALAATLVAAMIAAPANATTGMLYKAVSANGTVMFSDTPPSGDVQVVEQRALPSYGQPSRVNTASADTAQLFDADQEVARANEKVDLAEHALALARRDFGSTNAGIGLTPTRISMTDMQRIEFYKKNVSAARQYLAELVRDRQTQAARIVVSMN